RWPAPTRERSQTPPSLVERRALVRARSSENCWSRLPRCAHFAQPNRLLRPSPSPPLLTQYPQKITLVNSDPSPCGTRQTHCTSPFCVCTKGGNCGVSYRWTCMSVLG